jgi:ABC-type amino acid transport substrate-binding protein
MSTSSVLKATVLAFAVAAGASVHAQGTPINAAAFDALVAQGPVADATTIASSKWASKIKQADTLRLGATQTSNLFSMLNEKDGKIRGFDAGLAQMLTRYILGDGSKFKFTQVTSSTREQVLINDQVDMVLATYSITPARAEKISFAGPYYSSQAGVLVKSNNKAIQSYNDLAGKRTATQAGSTGPAILAQFAPKAVVQEFQTHQEALDALRQGRVEAYVTDYTLLLNVLSQGTGEAQLAGAPFGPQDPYGIGLPKGSDGVAFVNAFLKKIQADGTWGQAVDGEHRPAHRQHERSHAACHSVIDGERVAPLGRVRACLCAGPFAHMEAHCAVLRVRLRAGHRHHGGPVDAAAAASICADLVCRGLSQHPQRGAADLHRVRAARSQRRDRL